MGTKRKARTWPTLARIAVLATGTLVLAGCATGYDFVQPESAGGGSYYTSNSPYGNAGYYDGYDDYDVPLGYYGGGIAAPYYGFGGPYYGFGGFGYGYPLYGGADISFGLGLGSLCGWACAGLYGSPLYSLGYGYPLGWAPIIYESGHRHRHHHGNDTATTDARHPHDNWNAWRSWGTGKPGIAVAGQAVPADVASRPALPSAGFAPHHLARDQTSAVPPAERMTELVGPPAVAPGLRGTSDGFELHGRMPGMASAMPQAARASELVGPPAVAPGLRGTETFSHSAGSPMMQSAAPRSFSIPAIHPARAAPARSTASDRVR